MDLRRIVASFLIFLFVVVALPTFFVFGLNRTFLDPNFYGETVVSPAYEVLMNAVAHNIYAKDPVIQKHFKEEDIRKVVVETVPLDLFKVSMKGFSNDLEQVKARPEHPLTFDLKPYRSSLVKISQRLAIHLFQALPQCKSNELPEFTEEGIATCVPGGTNYEVVAGPLSKQFETGVLNALPDTVDLSLARDQSGSMFTFVLSSADKVRFYGIGALMVLIVLIAFVLYKPFTTIVRYEGVAFLFSGFLGFLMSLGLGEVPVWLVQMYASKNVGVVKSLGGELVLVKYFQQIFSQFTGEIQKISFVFLALGAVLLFIYFFFLRVDAKKPVEE